MNRLKELRKSRQMTQTEVAALVGIGQSGYSFWENGKSKIDDASLRKLATFYGVTVDYLLGHDSHAAPDTESTAASRVGALSEAEEDLLLAYRRADAHIRSMVDLALKPYKKSEQSEEAM